MSATIYLTTLALPLGTILLVFGMRYLSAVKQAQARIASDEAYRAVAEKAANAEAETAAALASIQSSMAEVRTRLAAVEKILKDVE
jgi:Tfp pilus assembly protein PilO